MLLLKLHLALLLVEGLATSKLEAGRGAHVLVLAGDRLGFAGDSDRGSWSGLHQRSLIGFTRVEALAHLIAFLIGFFVHILLAAFILSVLHADLAHFLPKARVGVPIGGSRVGPFVSVESKRVLPFNFRMNFIALLAVV
jgi:hypothetical protein